MENNDDTIFEEISIVDDEIKERDNDEITQPFENSEIDDMIEIPSHINHSEENDINENDIDELFQDEHDLERVVEGIPTESSEISSSTDANTIAPNVAPEIENIDTDFEDIDDATVPFF